MEDPFALARPSVARDVLARYGHRLGKSLGQHLLVDGRVLRRIVETARVGAADIVLEIGPGIGTLTRPLAVAAARVITIESDRRLGPVLDETLQGLGNVCVLWLDALTLDRAAVGAPEPGVLVANLPYNVAATLVLRLLDELPSIARGTVMVQREVAERMTARPGTKAYGGYTVKLALRAAARLAFRVPPAAFFPPPRVESAVVTFDRVRPFAEGGPDETPIPIVDAVVDAGFAQRRKMLRSALSASLGVPRDLVEEVVAASGSDPAARAETLTPEAFVRLARECARRGLVRDLLA